jgi:putative ABC transport system substrate-binding protein
VDGRDKPGHDGVDGLRQRTVGMQRREFIALFGSAAVTIPWPLAARAQQPKLAKIGVLIPANPESFRSESIWDVFRDGLSDNGYIEGRNIQFEVRSADGRPGLLPDLAAELVRLKVDMIVAHQTPAVTAASRATQRIPIVMAAAGDPVGTGLIASLARPGGNITGLSGTTTEMGGKILELIREMLPSARRVAVLANAADPFTKPFLGQIQLGGQSLGIAIQVIMIGAAGEFDAAFAAMKNERADAVIVQPSLPRKPAVDLALKHHVPPISPTRQFPGEGGLMSYSAGQHDLYRRAAVYVDRILKGAKPADLPVEQPTRFELVINLKTAKALGIEVPPSLLLRADEVIE